jgi:hypothetical protein
MNVGCGCKLQAASCTQYRNVLSLLAFNCIAFGFKLLALGRIWPHRCATFHPECYWNGCWVAVVWPEHCLGMAWELPANGLAAMSSCRGPVVSVYCT